jgi:beta-glucosidase
LLHGVGMPTDDPVTPENAPSNRGVGYAVGVPRLGIPGIDMSDAAYGVRSSGANGRYSTALPANVARLQAGTPMQPMNTASSSARTPRPGLQHVARRRCRTSPASPATAAPLSTSAKTHPRRNPGRPPHPGHPVAHVIGDIKHYAFNDQESGRNSVNITIGKRAARESDLLAFEIGVTQGNPAAVMCSYNRVNGDFACENKYLLTDVLKKDWNFPGFVLSDWGGTHSTEKASPPDSTTKSRAASSTAISTRPPSKREPFPVAELDEHVHRILRSMFAAGVIDYPRQRSVVDPFAALKCAQNRRRRHRPAQE